MHQSSYEKMDMLVSKYLDPKKETSILDVGSFDGNGSYRDIFTKCPNFKYEGCDIVDGPNVDFVILQYDIPKPDETYDVVISGQTMEHVEFFWNWIIELERVLKKGGLLILIVPSGGPIHRHPVDCWRFNPDGLLAVAKWANIEPLEVNIDLESEWKDCYLVAKK
jgi:SAM-dependent methyltransferase